MDEWLQTQPTAVQKFNTGATTSQWLRNIFHWYSFGVFDGEKLVAAVHFEPLGDNRFRAHVDASRGVMGMREQVRRACYGVGFALFEKFGAQEFECLVPPWQKINMSICRACGMRKTGQTVKVNGVDTVQFRITREEFVLEHQGRAKDMLRDGKQDYPANAGNNSN